MLDILVGGFYGDEGKGKIASYLALKDDPYIAIRTGSINAGHTISYEGKKYGLRSLPSAFINKKTKLAIPPGALIRSDVLFKELEETKAHDRLIIDYHTGVITDEDVREERENQHLSSNVGSTLQGVGSAESKRILRRLRLAKDYEEFSKYLDDVPVRVIEALEADKRVVVEGTQGHFLSLYHGGYPYVTSRNTTSSGILSEVGIGPKYASNIIVVFKSFITRVGGGPLDGELSDGEAKELGIEEFGTVTGRRRRVALFDSKLAKSVARINSANQIAITKLDTKFKAAHKIRRYGQLPEEARKWIEEIEEEIGLPITLIGTGEEAYDIIDMRDKIG